MKKIRIRTYRESDKSSIYTKQKSNAILLGNGQKLYLKSVSATENMLSEISQKLSFNLIELNELFIEIFIQYRRNWFYFDIRIQDERKINSLFKDTDYLMNMAVDRSSWPNGNYFTFKHLTTALHNLSTIIMILQELHQNRSNWAEIKILDAIKRRIDILIIDINSIGQ